ncbi:hypothetical protein Golob_005689, partial [Gossypium lobatum]|nr:hypothetical protein [Gossypium lobatum]
MDSSNISVSSPIVEFQEDNVEQYLQQLWLYTFVQEQGFDPLMRECKGMWENASEREWTKFCLLAEKPKVIPLADVLLTDLIEFRNIDIEEILWFLMDGKEMWTYKIGKRIPEAFNQELMIPKAKMWMKFVCSRILSTIEMSK